MLTHFVRLLLARTVNPFVFRPATPGKLEFSGDQVGLYFHIPFCRQICDFCPYNKILYDESLIRPFVKAVIREIESSRKKISQTIVINSIYFGGGTPALVIEYFSEILEAVERCFDIQGPRGIELQPSDVTPKNVELLEKNGFDMICLGVQSFSPDCLKKIGRSQEDSEERLKLLGRDFINVRDVDLIFGIPGQTPESLSLDFQTAVLRGATQISAYPFLNFSYTGRRYPPIGGRKQKELLGVLEGIAEKHGWERTSIWTFAEKGRGKYSSVTRDNFLGFGPGAASLLKDVFKINTFSVEAYIQQWEQGENPPSLCLRFNPRTRALYWLFWSSYSLLMAGGEFFDLFHFPLEEMFGRELKWGVLLGLLEKREGDYHLTPRGRLAFHRVEQLYTRQYIDKTWRACMEEVMPDRIRLY